MTAKSFADLPDAIFCNIIECLDWCEVARLDTALLDRNMRNIYLDALKLRKVKVDRRNGFWNNAVNKGILNWLVSRNIPVISWDLEVDNTKLMTIASGCPQLQSLNISRCSITDAGIIALANGCPQLQSLNIGYCDEITDEGIKALATGCSQLQSLDISGCYEITDAGRKIAERINRKMQLINY